MTSLADYTESQKNSASLSPLFFPSWNIHNKSMTHTTHSMENETYIVKLSTSIIDSQLY